MKPQSPISFDICICTFRRDSVRSLIESINQQDGLDECVVRIVVADNDDTPSALPTIDALRRSTQIEIHYVHAPARNISIARNACLDAASADWIIFIDDDETVSKGWLKAFSRAVQSETAEIYLGEVDAIYPDTAPEWARINDFHSTKAIMRHGEIAAGYTTNTCIRRRAIENRGLRFDLGYGRSGGEDTIFFGALLKDGARIEAWPKALAYESVPESRLSLAWLCERKHRSGHTQGTVWIDGRGSIWRCRIMVTSLFKWLYCEGRSLLSRSKIRSSYWKVRGCAHRGALAACLGLGRKDLYGGS